MDFWTRLLIAGTLISRITWRVEGDKSNHRIAAWTPWMARNLAHNSAPTENPSALAAPPAPLPSYIQPVQHRVGVIASPTPWQHPWILRGPAVTPTQAPRSSRSFFERFLAFVPSLLSLFGVGGGGKGSQAKSPLDDIFRMFGVESSGLSVLAMNVLVFLAEKIANRFLPTDTNEIGEGRGFEDKSSWLGLNIPSQEKIREISNALSDSHLTEKVINNMGMINGNKTICLQKLVCKMTPVVKGMQKYLFVNENNASQARNDARMPSFWVTRLYKVWPSLSEFTTSSDTCNHRFAECTSY